MDLTEITFGIDFFLNFDSLTHEVWSNTPYINAVCAQTFNVEQEKSNWRWFICIMGETMLLSVSWAAVGLVPLSVKIILDD